MPKVKPGKPTYTFRPGPDLAAWIESEVERLKKENRGVEATPSDVIRIELFKAMRRKKR